MRYWVGVTDRNWFMQFRQQKPEEVSFWQPSPTSSTNVLQPGIPG